MGGDHVTQRKIIGSIFEGNRVHHTINGFRPFVGIYEGSNGYPKKGVFNSWRRDEKNSFESRETVRRVLRSRRGICEGWSDKWIFQKFLGQKNGRRQKKLQIIDWHHNRNRCESWGRNDPLDHSAKIKRWEWSFQKNGDGNYRKNSLGAGGEWCWSSIRIKFAGWHNFSFSWISCRRKSGDAEWFRDHYQRFRAEGKTLFFSNNRYYLMETE